MTELDLEEVSQNLRYDAAERVFYVEARIVSSKPLVLRANEPVRVNIPLSARSLDKIQEVLKGLAESDSQFLN